MEKLNGAHSYTTPTDEQGLHQENGAPRRDDASFGALLSDLAQETTTLAQQEIALARAEMSEKISHLGSALAALIIGGFVLFAGLLKLLDAAIYGIAEALPADVGPWLAALIVGGIVTIIGLIMLQKGRRDLQSERVAPQRTMDSLQRDTDMVKEQVR